MGESVAMQHWTISKASDLSSGKESFVARRFEIRPGVITPTQDFLRAENVLELRRRFRSMGMVCLFRDPNDKPEVMETWL